VGGAVRGGREKNTCFEHVSKVTGKGEKQELMFDVPRITQPSSPAIAP